jgi:nucleoside phosphorylase
LLVSKFDAKKILNFGVAGSLNQETELCGVYQITAAVQFDFDLVQLNGTKIGTLNEYEENYLQLNRLDTSFPCKKLGTADRFNDSVSDYQLLTKELNADIRDMEGAAIAHVCKKNSVRCRMVKCITNVAGKGAMTGQYEFNRELALKRLADAMKEYIHIC